MKKVLFVLLTILLVFGLWGCSRFNGGSIYSVNYNGKLKTLVNKDYNALRDFIMTGEFEEWEDKREISCKDCTLIRGRGAYGTADIIAGVFYEEGLAEYSERTTNGYYDRFRDDYVFAIDFKNGETYWFVSYSDALQWIQQNYS